MRILWLIVLLPTFAYAAGPTNAVVDSLTTGTLNVGGSVVTLGGALTTNNPMSFFSSGGVSVTLPTSGTILNSSGVLSDIAAALPSATVNQVYVGSGTAGQAGFVSTIPASVVAGSNRIWSGGANDTVMPTDNGGVVVFMNGSTANTITLSASATPVVTDIVCTGSASCTLAAATGASLNGTAAGYLTLTAKTDYHVIMADNASTTAADWYVK